MQICWLGLTLSMAALWSGVTIHGLVVRHEPLRALVGVSGLISTLPGVYHYARLVVRSHWSLRTGDSRRIRTFW